jgi:4-hydroxy-3-methylbut-2-enyl diphosphate reductase
MSDEHLTPSGDEPEAGGASNAAEASATATATDEAPKPAPDEPSPQAAAEQPAAQPATPEPAEPPATPSEPQFQTIPEPPAPVIETPAAEAPAPPPAPPAQPIAQAPAPEPAKPMDEFAAAVEAFGGAATGTSYDEAYRPLRKGEMLTATVIQVDETRAFVDLGTKAEGVIPLEELGTGTYTNASEVVKKGDQIKVVVIQTDTRDGNPIVSKKRADFHAAWDNLLAEFDKKETINAFVVGRVKGGLEVDLGVRGFVPGSHVGTGKLRNLDKYVGTTIPVKIIDVDRERKKVVLSNRLAEDELREERKQQIFERVKPGEVLDGTVRRLVDYGAFIDLGGVDGLLHVSEMAWSRVDHPREVLQEGDDVRVMVLRLDEKSGRISLGRRQVLPDPWALIRENYRVGQRMTVPITRVVQSGAFVKLEEGAEAFIPASEMSHRRVSKPADVVTAGSEVEVQVIELRPDERRMVLSMRALLPYEPQGRDDYVSHSSRDRERGDHRDRGRDRGRGGRGGGGGGGGRHEASDGGRGATIGERLGALRGFVHHADDDDFGDDDLGDEQKDAAAEAEAQAPTAEAPAEPAAEAATEPAAEAPAEPAAEAATEPSAEPAAEQPAPEAAEPAEPETPAEPEAEEGK